jgi:N-acetylglutamate synthase-like GNAT family acetyltransferase
LTLRTRLFGLSNPRSAEKLAALTRQLWVLSRVVLHPTYRGAGVAAPFVRRACQLCPVSWIEALAAMGHANPFFEKAGFKRIGVIRKTQPKNDDALGRFREPVYYVLNNKTS